MSAHDASNSKVGSELSLRHDDPFRSNTPPLTSNKYYDLQAIPNRTRRQRPQKLRLVEQIDQNDSSRDESRNLYETEFSSFVTGCIPGASFAAGSSQRRTRLIRQRSLPLLSYLASTHLAAAEKKRKKDDIERLNSIAEEEARKALLLNPIKLLANESGGWDEEKNQTDARNCDKQRLAAPKITIKTEQSSNILMPPLLNQLS